MCANKKNSLELFHKIIENKLDFLWGCQVRADVTKDEAFVKKMAQAGCYRVYVGYESINEDVLNSLKKRETLADIERSIKVFHKYGISICGLFIFGNDLDNMKVIKDTVRFAIREKLEFTQYSLLTPYPGTDLSNSLEKDRLTHDDWDILDVFHVNIKPKQMSEYELMMGLLYAHEKFYSWPRVVRQIWSNILFILFNWRRPLHYRIFRLSDDLVKISGYRKMIKNWKSLHRDYHDSLKKKSMS